MSFALPSSIGLYKTEAIWLAAAEVVAPITTQFRLGNARSVPQSSVNSFQANTKPENIINEYLCDALTDVHNSRPWQQGLLHEKATLKKILPTYLSFNYDWENDATLVEIEARSHKRQQPRIRNTSSKTHCETCLLHLAASDTSIMTVQKINQSST
jgi:hypothetical protein